MGRYGEISRASARLPRNVRQHELAALDAARLVAQLAVFVLRAPLDLDLVARTGGGHAELDVLQRVGLEHVEPAWSGSGLGLGLGLGLALGLANPSPNLVLGRLGEHT